MSLDFSANYDASFMAVGFWEVGYEGGFSAPSADLLEDTAKLRIPGSDTTVIQKFGQATREFDMPIAINAADVPSLVAKRGKSGALVFHNGTVTAFFDGIKNPRLTGDGLQIFNMTLHFTL